MTIANGGTIVYTDVDGLNPSSVPTVNSYYKVHIFNSSADLEVSEAGNLEYLIIGGGGAGGVYGGGGAGGVLTGTKTVTTGTKAVVVGDGGTPVGSGDPTTTLPSAGNGEDSTFDGLLAHGGGGGGNLGNNNVYEWGADGGSGGGGGFVNLGSTVVIRGGYTLDSQGYDGGKLYNTTGLSGCGGGGGAGAVGGDGWRDGISSTYFGGNGGNGISNSMSGVATDYAGGGGGGVKVNEVWWNYNPGEGANGGGNGGIDNSTVATPADANTGSGGGGGYSAYAPDSYGTSGGSGIVVVRYLYVSEVAPTVVTDDATDETASTFTANGEVVSENVVSEILERGFWYTDDNKEPSAVDYTESETGTFTAGTFDLPITTLIPGIDYKVKAFATNSIGTGSGDSVVVSLPDITNTPTVETLPESLVATTSFTANGRITQAGQDWYIDGVLFTGTVIRVKAGQNVNLALSNATVGSLVVIEPGVYAGTYWILNKKLYVKGLGALPSDTVIPGRWDVSNGNGGSIIENLTINGEILDNNPYFGQTVIFNKCIVGNPNGNTLQLYNNATTIYFINTKMVRSASGVTIASGGYSSRAFVNRIFFQKVEFTLPITTSPTAVYMPPAESDYVFTPTVGYGYLYGTDKITVTGTPNATARGFVYSEGTIENPNLTDYDGIFTESGDFGEEAFSHLFSGLTEGTAYRYRAFATNSYGTSYGDVEVVTTTEAEPSLDIYAATLVDLTSFSISGKITYSGGSTPTTRGFIYKIGTGVPTIADKDGIFTATGSFGSDVFSHIFSGLAPNTTYTIRAYATNSYDTGYSTTVQVITLPNLVITTIDCTNITASSFRANASIAPSTFGVVTVGFLYAIAEEPYVWQSGSSSGDYTGTANFSRVVGAAINTQYLVRAFVEYRGHTYYGEIVLVSTIVLTGISVSPILPEISIGQTVQLTVTGTYSDGTVVDITSSSFYSEEDLAEFVPVYGEENTFLINPITGQTIATVTSGGLIVAMSAGLAKIFIYASEYKTFYNTVVVQPDEGTVDVGGIWDGELASGTILPSTNAISIIMDEIMYEGDSQQAYLLGQFDDSPETEAYLSNYDAVWTSSNPDVATVDAGGLIVGVSVGITFIKAVYIIEDSPVQTFTTMVMLRVEAKEGQWIDGQTYQYIPLLPTPNQSFRTTVATSADRSISLNLFLCWNKETECWEMTISDPVSEEYYVDSIPLFVGEDSMFNLLRLYQYLNIGSCYMVDISGKGTGKPSVNNLGIDFLMVWGYTE